VLYKIAPKRSRERDFRKSVHQFLRRRIDEPTIDRRLYGEEEGVADKLPVMFIIPHKSDQITPMCPIRGSLDRRSKQWTRRN
jgi:hypothetical protein